MSEIERLLKQTALELRSVSNTPRLDAELLLCEACACSRSRLAAYAEPALSAAQRQKFSEYLKGRKDGEPVAYITGRKEFWSLSLQVNQSVLIPRPETELLVERALLALARMPDRLRILDLGTGSGCIALALAAELKKLGREFEIIALDNSAAALAVAQKNALSLGLLEKIEFGLSDWFLALSRAGSKFDLIVCNPPYVALGAQVSPGVAFEPPAAVFSGRDGLQAIKHIFAEAQAFMNAQASLICEIGEEQGGVAREFVKNLCAAGKYQNHCLQISKDLRGRDRICELSPE